MQIQGPDRYQLAFTPHAFKILCAKGTDKFSGMARLGWNAKGEKWLSRLRVALRKLLGKPRCLVPRRRDRPE